MKTVLKWSQVLCRSSYMCSVIGFHFKWFTVVQRLKCIIIMYSVLAYNDNVCSMFLLIIFLFHPHSLFYFSFFSSILLSFSSAVVCAYLHCSDDIIWMIFSSFSHKYTHCWWLLIYHYFVGSGYLHQGWFLSNPSSIHFSAVITQIFYSKQTNCFGINEIIEKFNRFWSSCNNKA